MQGLAPVDDPGGGPLLYVREGCHLCEQFQMELSLDLALDDSVTVLDVDQDADLAAEFGLRVPVLVVAGEIVCEGVYDRPRVRAALRV
jgi:hypothetical protein